ncbi:MAG: O-antigen ligase family protein [Chlamydiota bacterium]
MKKRFPIGSVFCLLFFGCVVLSLLFSQTPVFYPQWGMVFHLALVILFFLVLSSVDMSLNGLHKILFLFLLVSIIPCLIGLSHYLLQHSLGLSFIGEPVLDPLNGKLGSIGVSSGRLWIFDLLLPHQGSSLLFRSYGTFGHPNVFGGFLFVSLMVTSYFYVTYPKKKLFFQIVLFLQTLALFTTFSRSALFAWLISLSLFVILICWKKKTFPSSLLKTALCALLLSLILFGEQWWDRGGFLNYNRIVQKTDNERVEKQGEAISLIATHPWLGVGWNNYLVAVESMQPKSPPQPTHNMYLMIASESGLPALCFFLLMIGFSIYNGWKRQTSFTFFLAATVVGFLFIGMCDFYPIFDQKGRLLFFLALGLLNVRVFVKEKQALKRLLHAV